MPPAWLVSVRNTVPARVGKTWIRALARLTACVSESADDVIVFAWSGSSGAAGSRCVRRHGRCFSGALSCTAEPE